MTTIPTLDKISGNTVMQKFRSLAKAVIDTLTSFGEQTDYIITDLAPRLESNLDVLTTKLAELNDTLNTVSELAGRVDAVLDNMVTTNTIQTITALKRFSGGLAVYGGTTFDGEVQVTNGHNLAVAGDIDCANDMYTDGLTVREQAEISGMAIEPSGTKTVLSNDNGIIVTGGLDTDVPTTTTGARDTKAANGTRIQNDLDNYASMVRLTGNQAITGIKAFTQVPGSLSYHVRITGTSKIELCRYTVSGAVEVGIYIEAFSRGNGIIGRLLVAYDGESSIAITFTGTTIYGGLGLAHFYAYVDNGQMIISFGNESSGNYHYAINVKGAFYGAGLDLGLDYSKIGTSHTQDITTDTSKYQWGST